MKCVATTKFNKQCTKTACKDSDKCHIHKVKVLDNNVMYKKELSVLHKRVMEYSSKNSELIKKYDEINDELEILKKQMELIEYCDFLKQKLIDIGGGNRPFREILTSKKYANQVEELLNVSHRKARAYYFDIVDRRNKLCHPYTMDRVFKLL